MQGVSLWITQRLVALTVCTHIRTLASAMKITPWSIRIRALQKAGFSLRDISDAIGLSRGAVGDLAVGRNEAPKGDAALALDALHRECMSAKKAAARLAAVRREHRGNNGKRAAT